jgi:hypothetical protein
MFIFSFLHAFITEFVLRDTILCTDFILMANGRDRLVQPRLIDAGARREEAGVQVVIVGCGDVVTESTRLTNPEEHARAHGTTENHGEKFLREMIFIECRNGFHTKNKVCLFRLLLGHVLAKFQTLNGSSLTSVKPDDLAGRVFDRQFVVLL